MKKIFLNIKYLKIDLLDLLISNVLLMIVDRDVFYNLDKDFIRNKVARTSEELTKKLSRD